jgi:hypothetical protein
MKKKRDAVRLAFFNIFKKRLLTHHDLGDNVENLLVAAAATGGALRDSLYVAESRENAVKILVHIKRVRDVRVGYLLTIAYHIILYHNITSDYIFD